MIIRKARPSDSKVIAPLLLSAMEEIVYEFLGEKNHQKAIDFLEYFAQRENNQYSYQNCWVAEASEVVGVVNIYDGAQLKTFRKPISEYIKTHHQKDFNPEDETEAGEFYIDSFGVNPNQQGKGVGSMLLQFLIDEYVIKNQKTIGLLVEGNNPKAKKLYLKLGFKSVGYCLLVGENLERLQITPS